MLTNVWVFCENIKFSNHDKWFYLILQFAKHLSVKWTICINFDVWMWVSKVWKSCDRVSSFLSMTFALFPSHMWFHWPLNKFSDLELTVKNYQWHTICPSIFISWTMDHGFIWSCIICLIKSKNLYSMKTCFHLGWMNLFIWCFMFYMLMVFFDYKIKYQYVFLAFI